MRRSISPEDALPDREPRDYEPYLIYRVVVGSVAYGLAEEDSDSDERGVFLPPADWHWSLSRLPQQVEFKVTPSGDVVDHNEASEANDVCWWELEKFLRLGLRANPTALELLWVGDEHVLAASPLGEELRALRGAFLSRHVYHTYSGYVLSQFRRMTKAAERGTSYRPKHAVHLLRLLWSGITLLRTGELLVDVREHRDELLSIKRAPPPLEDVRRRALELAAVFQDEYVRTSLPDAPDVARVDRFLVAARRSVT